MAIHPPTCGCDAYGCRKRREGYGYVSNVATPTKTPNRPFRPGPQFNSWEKGVAGEHRPDGTFMPYLNDSGGQIGIKEYGERRRELDGIRSRQRSGAAVDN